MARHLKTDKATWDCGTKFPAFKLDGGTHWGHLLGEAFGWAVLAAVMGLLLLFAGAVLS